MPIEFVGVVNFGTHVAAEFEKDVWSIDSNGQWSNRFRMNRASLEIRIANIEKNGRDASVERSALAELKRLEAINE